MYRFILLTGLTFTTAIICKGQEDSLGRTLENITVTANRYPQKKESTGKVLTVIPREVLERNAGRTLGDVLQQQSGFMIPGATNAPGTNQDVYLRGFATGNTLILIDGVPVYDVSTITNTFDLNQFPADQIERVEILKGAQSTLYGSDAVAGVIHIITRKQGQRPIQGQLAAGAGSFGTWQVQGGLQGRSGGSSYQLGYKHFRSQGFSAAFDSSGKGDFDKDGMTQDIVQGAYQLKLSPSLQWNLNGRGAWYQNDLDAAAFTDDRDFNARNLNYLLGTGLTYQFGEGSLHANYQVNKVVRKYLDDSTDIGGFAKFSKQQYEGLSQFAEVYANWKASSVLTLVAGVDFRAQGTNQDFLSVSSFGPFETKLSSDSARIRIYSAYASAVLQGGGGFLVEGGLRYNHHSLFGSNVTGNINPSFRWDERWTFFANLSTGFKAPSLYQLYDAYAGNRDLDAETSISTETGVQYQSKNRAWTARAVAFAGRIKNGIEYSLADFRYFNNNLQKNRGLELEAAFKNDRYQLSANYTFVRGEVNTVNYQYDPPSFSYKANGDTTYNNLFRRPRHALNLTAGIRPIPSLWVSASLRMIGKRMEPRFQQAPIPMEPYQTLDVYADYRLGNHLTLFFDLRNLFNEQYQDVWGYGTRPRNFMAGLRLQF